MQLREQSFQLVDVHVQDSLEELAAYFFEPQLQLRSNASTPVRSLKDHEPMIARIASAGKKAPRFQSVNVTRNLPFVSAHGFGNLPGRSFSFFCAMHQHRRLLRRHPELAETSIERGLQPYARAEEPRYGKLRLPFPYPNVFPGRLLPFAARITQ
jgi:hypothetical protein